MAILEDKELLDILVKNPNRKLIDFGREQRKKARLHMYGVGLQDHLPQIPGFESNLFSELRIKYALSNKDMFGRQYKPIKKVFTARGTTTYYNMGDMGNALASSLEKRVRNGISCKKWIEDQWCRHSVDDPMGIIFIEVDQFGVAYPTYKTIENIYDYKLDGTGLEYVIWKLTNEQKTAEGFGDEDVVFRVVDDVEDRFVKLIDSQRLETIVSKSYSNLFNDVPAVINGFIPNPDGEGFVSLFWYVFDLADTFLTQTSIKLTHMFRHGFPKYFEFADDCVECKGTGKKDGQPHKECMGTGRRIMFKPSDVKALEYPTKDSPLPSSFIPGGYIEPSEVFYKIVSQELESIEEKIQRTIWNAKASTKMKKGVGLSGGPNGTITATEVMDNRQPELDNLNDIADAAEARDKFIMDHLIEVNMQMFGYRKRGGCSKSYGRRYLMEEPDALLEKYVAARKEGLSAGILYGLYDQYLEAKFQSDFISLNFHKKMMKVEPFMHYTLAELKANGATPEDIRKKQYYGDWYVSLKNDDLFSFSAEELIKSFEKFVSTKPLPVEEKDPKAVLN